MPAWDGRLAHPAWKCPASACPDREIPPQPAFHTDSPPPQAKSITSFNDSPNLFQSRMLRPFVVPQSIKGAEAVMKRLWIAACLVFPLAALMAVELPSGDSWLQWAKNPQHTGFIQLSGQSASHKLAEIRYDPFVNQEKRDDFGELIVHYQVPLTKGDSVYMEFKTGKWIPCNPRNAWTTGAACGPNTWEKQIWNEKRLDWHQGKLRE